VLYTNFETYVGLSSFSSAVTSHLCKSFFFAESKNMIDKIKSTKLKKSKKYLNLPFEVYFSGPINYSTLEFLSETGKLKKPKDIKGLHLERCHAFGTVFYCAENMGPELYCCLTGGHDETAPEWLELVAEEGLKTEWGETYRVTFDRSGIVLDEKSEEDLLEELVPTGFSTGMYHLEGENPDYIILDADGDRIKINLAGYAFDENDEIIVANRIIDVESLRDDESLSNYTTAESWDVQDSWIKDLWETHFSKLTPVKIKKYVPI
jgi:hypothetical protein